MEAFLLAFAIVFVAEIGDKTQLIALSFGARYGLALVLSAVTVAFAITNGISVVIGGLLGAALPTRAIAVIGALAFYGFAVWTLADRGDEEDEPRARVGGRSVFLSLAAAVVIGELGDKTMLATATLATRESPLMVWFGATAGITASGAMAVLVGRALGARLPRRATRIGAATLFALFGTLLLLDTFVW